MADFSNEGAPITGKGKTFAQLFEEMGMPVGKFENRYSRQYVDVFLSTNSGNLAGTTVRLPYVQKAL